MISKKTIAFLLKTCIVFFALFFLYKELIAKTHFEQFKQIDVLEKIKENYIIFFIVIIMMFINWFIEALKWQFLISKIERISIIRSLRAIFSGITVSTFTPNRIGEYGGRVFCLDIGDRIQAVFITVIGSMGQLVITIFFGSIGLVYLPFYSSEIHQIIQAIDFAYPVLIFLCFLLNILLILLFLNASLISNMLNKISFLKKYDRYTEVFSFYNSKELFKVLLYSSARYLVFTTQFFILLRLFDVTISYSEAIILIMIMLFVISVIPTIAITELGVRGSVAVFLFGLVSSNTIGILFATFFIWFINLVLPAIIGTIFIFTLKFFRK